MVVKSFNVISILFGITLISIVVNLGIYTMKMSSLSFLTSHSNFYKLRWYISLWFIISFITIICIDYMICGPEVAVNVGSSLRFNGISLIESLVYLSILGCVILAAVMRDIRVRQEEVVMWILLIVGCGLVYMSNDFILLVTILELITIISYVMASLPKINKDASVKYLVFSIFASLFLLFGIFVVYSCSGTLVFDELNVWSRYCSEKEYTWGIGFISISFLVKAGAAPFYYWAIEVYRKSSDLAFILFMGLNKVLIIGILLKLYLEVFVGFNGLNTVFTLVGIGSIVVGVCGAIYYYTIKGFFAYGGLVGLGYVILLLSINDSFALIASYVYLVSYSITVVLLLFFLYRVNRFRKYQLIKSFHALSGTFENRWATVGIILSLVSLIGIPPVLGFIAKFYLLSSLYSGKRVFLFTLIILVGVVSSFYYLRVLFFCYQRKFQPANFQQSYEIGCIIIAILLLFLSLYPVCYYGSVVNLIQLLTYMC